MLFRYPGRFTIAVLTIPSIATAWWYRPIGNHEGNVNGPERSGWPYMSKRNIQEELHSTPAFINIARNIVTPVVVIFWRFILNYSPFGGELTLVHDENYDKFVAAMIRRKSNQAIITVANHRSLLDDPLVMCNLLPWHVAIQPKYLRWAACSQEYCFTLPSLITAFFGAGKTLGVWRGGGVNQRQWLDYARHVFNGDWCHVFPEAGIWQNADGTLGGRGAFQNPENNTKNITRDDSGKLKWGIGKLIAHAPVTPIVVPFYHIGMERMLEQNPKTRRLMKPLIDALLRCPLDKGVHIAFGEEIDFTDLLLEYEIKNKCKLKKFTTSSKADSMKYMIDNPNKLMSIANNIDNEGVLNFHQYWDSSPSELELYHKITLRIEAKMIELEKKQPAYIQRHPSSSAIGNTVNK
jgi:1-acyl-sn-glycerol-3-phosphate acyltransferase